ncbi:putative disease resistance RPP13-like protein 3 [Carex rostrata]
MAETIVNLVLVKLSEAVVQEALFLSRVRDKVQRVQRDLKWIQSFLKDAETKRHKDERVKQWVNEVQEVGYLIEDVLEKFLTEVGGGRSEGLPSILKKIGKMPMKLISKHKVGNEIDQIRERLREIKENTTMYKIEGLKESSSGASVKLPIRLFLNPDIDDMEVVGFEVDKKIIVDKLFDTNITRRSVISIVGAGGSGKTTLAKDVYKCAEVKRHFGISMWLTISQEYNLKDILIKMLEQIQEVHKEEQEKGEEYFITELNKCMKKKRYLVVLDDVWSSDVWTQLEFAFPNAHNGSRVLITTRFIEIPEMADNISKPHEIQPLNEEDSKQLLLGKIFPNQFANECPSEVLPLATQFTKICGGWPLPLVVLGGILPRKKCQLPYMG